MNVRDIMTPAPETIQATATIEEAAQKMFERDIRHLPVLQGREVIGMMSDRDLHGFHWSFRNEIEDPAKLETFPQRKVSEVMTGDVISVSPEDTVQTAIDLMLENKVGAVMVIESDTEKLAGILSYVDILQAARETL